MPHIFRKGDDGLLTELPRDYGYAGQMYSTTVMIQAIVLWNAAEIAEREAQIAQDAESQKTANAEREAQVQRRAEILGRLGLTEEEGSALLAGK